MSWDEGAPLAHLDLDRVVGAARLPDPCRTSPPPIGRLSRILRGLLTGRRPLSESPAASRLTACARGGEGREGEEREGGRGRRPAQTGRPSPGRQTSQPDG